MELSFIKEKDKLDFHIVKNGISVGKSTGGLNVGGSDTGMRPMEMFASSLALCASIDAVHILEKQRIQLKHLGIKVLAERFDDEVPAVFKHIVLEYEIKEEKYISKLTKAVNLSLNRYCSVKAMIKKGVRIESKISVIE